MRDWPTEKKQLLYLNICMWTASPAKSTRKAIGIVKDWVIPQLVWKYGTNVRTVHVIYARKNIVETIVVFYYSTTTYFFTIYDYWAEQYLMLRNLEQSIDVWRLSLFWKQDNTNTLWLQMHPQDEYLSKNWTEPNRTEPNRTDSVRQHSGFVVLNRRRLGAGIFLSFSP